MNKVEGDPLYAAARPKRPAQVHHHHAEDVHVAVAERVDVVDDREKNIYKNSLTKKSDMTDDQTSHPNANDRLLDVQGQPIDNDV